MFSAHPDSSLPPLSSHAEDHLLSPSSLSHQSALPADSAAVTLPVLAASTRPHASSVPTAAAPPYSRERIRALRWVLRARSPAYESLLHHEEAAQRGDVSHLASVQLGVKRRELERQEAMASLVKSERAYRADITCREDERWSRLLVDAHYVLEKALTFHKRQTLLLEEEDRLAAEDAVRHHRALAALTEAEQTVRQTIVADEAQQRCFICGSARFEQLSASASVAQAQSEAASALYRQAAEVRQLELRLVKRSYRPPAAPLSVPPVHLLLFPQNPSASPSRLIRTDLLMDYSVQEEEFAARQGRRQQEAFERLPLTWWAGAVLGVMQEEQRARCVLTRTFHFGCSHTQLTAVITVQRWWRQLRCVPWSMWRRAALHCDVAAYCSTLTSEDYRVKVDRLEQRHRKALSPTWTSQESEAQLKRMQRALESAAVRSSQALLIDYLLSLSRRAANYWRSTQHDARIAYRVAANELQELERLEESSAKTDDARHRVQQAKEHLQCVGGCHAPYGVDLRPGWCYEKWRQGRWWRGSTAYLTAVQRITCEEEQQRDDILMEEGESKGRLHTYVTVLQRGYAAATRWMDAVEVLEYSESDERALLRFDEACARDMYDSAWGLLASQVESAWRPFRLLCEAEAHGRQALCDAAEQALRVLVSDEWRWSRLAAARVRLAAPGGGRGAWRLLPDSSRNQKFTSLDSVAAVITRCLRAVTAQRRTTDFTQRLRARRDRRRELNRDGAVLLRQVAQLLKEKNVKQNRQQRLTAPPLTTSTWPPTAAGLQAPGYVGQAALAFRAWFNVEVDSRRRCHPQRRSSQAIGESRSEKTFLLLLNRFLHANSDALLRSRVLFDMHREQRAAIEAEEARAFASLRKRFCYRVWVTFAVESQEGQARTRLITEEAADWVRLLEDELDPVRQLQLWSHAGQTLTSAYLATREVLPLPNGLPLAVARGRCALFAKPTAVEPRWVSQADRLGGSFPAPPRSPAPSPALGSWRPSSLSHTVTVAAKTREARCSPLMQCIQREEVCRARVVREANTALGATLLAFSQPFRASIGAAEEQARADTCFFVDRAFPSQPPLAALSVLAVEEHRARCAVETGAVTAFGALLVQAHQHYGDVVLFRPFTFAHLTMMGAAVHMDRALCVLLLERVRSLGSKPNDLVRHEAAARSRVVYEEEITRLLRFVWKKVAW